MITGSPDGYFLCWVCKDTVEHLGINCEFFSVIEMSVQRARYSLRPRAKIARPDPEAKVAPLTLSGAITILSADAVGDTDD